MLRRFRRPVALLAPLLLVSGLAAACGEEQNLLSGAQDRLDAVSVSGEVGASPEVTWDSKMDAGKAETEVLTEGDGDPVEDGQTAIVNYYVGNGFTESAALDTYGPDDLALAYPVGGEVAQPRSQQPTPEETTRYLLDAFVASQVEAGDTIGTRKVVTVNSAEVVGYSGGLGIGNADGLLIVIDVSAVALEGPEGTRSPQEAWVPEITAKDSLPAELDFSGVTPPDGSLKVATLIEGEGDDVATGEMIVVDYLGQVFDAKAPFDASFSRGTPLPTGIGVGAVVKGWDQGLVGVPVGSRVMLQIPPKLGYGKAGSGETIPPDSTLYFVVDILAAG